MQPTPVFTTAALAFLFAGSVLPAQAQNRGFKAPEGVTFRKAESLREIASRLIAYAAAMTAACMRFAFRHP